MHRYIKTHSQTHTHIESLWNQHLARTHGTPSYKQTEIYACMLISTHSNRDMCMHAYIHTLKQKHMHACSYPHTQTEICACMHPCIIASRTSSGSRVLQSTIDACILVTLAVCPLSWIFFRETWQSCVRVCIRVCIASCRNASVCNGFDQWIQTYTCPHTYLQSVCLTNHVLT